MLFVVFPGRTDPSLYSLERPRSHRNVSYRGPFPNPMSHGVRVTATGGVLSKQPWLMAYTIIFLHPEDPPLIQ